MFRQGVRNLVVDALSKRAMVHARALSRWLHGLALVAGCTANPGKPADLPTVDVLPAREVVELVEEHRVRAPIELTASDGTGLELVSLDAHAVVEGPLAFTELHLAFDNPHDRRIEGRFAIELPPRAAISRLAMKIGGQWQEGEVVERQSARVAYEDALHRRQDPALLEHDAGNLFTARVFPIEAGERKEIIVSYSQELTRAFDGYRLPLVGLPRLQRLDAELRMNMADGEPEVFSLHQRDVVPAEDFTAAAGPVANALRHDDLALARVVVGGDAEPVALDSLVVLFDTSASGAPGFDGRIVRVRRLLEALAAEVGGSTPVRLLAFDQSTVELGRGTLASIDDAVWSKLASRRALGASDLAAALRDAGEGALPGTRVLVVSDGVATAGGTELVELERAAAQLADAGVVRIDALAAGSSRADGTLAALTTAPRLDAGLVIEEAVAENEAAQRLRKRAHDALPVSVPGARWVWPEQLSGVQPGDEVLIYAHLPADAPLRIELGDAVIEPESDDTLGPLLQRAWIGAYLARLTEKRSRLLDTDTTGRNAIRKMIVEASTHHRVLSDFTALLVLERDSDYRRFGIARRGQDDIMVVGDGVAVEHADPSGHFLASPYGSAFAVGNDDEDVWGGLTGTEIAQSAGGLGLVGTGRGGGGHGEGVVGLGRLGLIGTGGGGSGSGYGHGSGAGFGGHGSGVATVRSSRPVVEGPLDRDLVRRIARAHVNEIRWCFMQVLERDPTAHGSLTVGWVATPAGRVSHASVLASTIHDEELGVCATRALRRWRMPKGEVGKPALVFMRYGLGAGHTPKLTPTPAQRARLAAAAVGAIAHDLAYQVEDLRKVMVEAAADARALDETARRDAELARTEGSPYDGKMFDVMTLLAAGSKQEALELALDWHEREPGDVLALVALGETAEAAGDTGTAARAYGSIIDLFPARADLRRYAGARLERIGGDALALAIDDYRVALDSRPDHPSSHRALAMALAKAGELREAADVLRGGLHESRILWGRFPEAQRILREDLALVAAAWLAAEPSATAEVRALLDAEQLTPSAGSSLRFVLTWETDANDVDFHIHDGHDGHAFYSDRKLESGGELYADITTGYGPECFAIPGTPGAFPYRLRAHYYARGPMGYGMGRVQVVQHDGNGKLVFAEHPFVAMKDKAWVELGTIAAPLQP